MPEIPLLPWRTLAIRVRKYDRTRNLKRSSSVCNMTSVKLDLGSMVPVISSIVSIYCTPDQRHVSSP